MAYKIPSPVKFFRETVPLESFFILLCERRVDHLLIGKCLNHHPKHYTSYDEAVEAAEKLITDKMLAVVYRAIPIRSRFTSTRRYELWRIVDGVNRMHSRPTTKEKVLWESLVGKGITGL